MKIKQDDITFNRGGYFIFDKRVTATFYLNSFQSGNGQKGIDGEIERLTIEMIFDDDPNSSGIIEDCWIKIISYDKQSKIFHLDEVDPERLYWIGQGFLEIAKHFGFDRKKVKELNKEEIRI